MEAYPPYLAQYSSLLRREMAPGDRCSGPSLWRTKSFTQSLPLWHYYHQCPKPRVFFVGPFWWINSTCMTWWSVLESGVLLFPWTSLPADWVILQDPAFRALQSFLRRKTTAGRCKHCPGEKGQSGCVFCPGHLHHLAADWSCTVSPRKVSANEKSIQAVFRWREKEMRKVASNTVEHCSTFHLFVVIVVLSWSN